MVAVALNNARMFKSPSTTQTRLSILNCVQKDDTSQQCGQEIGK